MSCLSCFWLLLADDRTRPMPPGGHTSRPPYYFIAFSLGENQFSASFFLISPALSLFIPPGGQRIGPDRSGETPWLAARMTYSRIEQRLGKCSAVFPG